MGRILLSESYDLEMSDINFLHDYNKSNIKNIAMLNLIFSLMLYLDR